MTPGKLTRRFVAAVALLWAAHGALALDTDGDGVVDAQDNCINDANPAQTDSNNDHFGNICDADLNDDGVVNVVDLGILRKRFFSADADADFNGDGAVNVVDLGIMRLRFFAAPGPSGVAIANTPLQLTQIYTNAFFSSPLAMRMVPGDDSRWYVLERGGRFRSIEAVDTASSIKELMLTPGVDTNFEGGALGFDFHPDFANNGHVYISYTTEGPNFSIPLISRISRFDTSVDPDDGLLIADPLSEVEVLAVNQPFANHNGGNLLFGPDGYLYLGLGDGGSGGDPSNHGQRTETMLGAMLRIDVNVTAADFANGVRYYIPADNPFSDSADCAAGECPEIFAYGLRNPWRFSFDRETGDLWAADVGQSSREEIDIVTLGGNYGWRCREGFIAFSTTAGCPPLVDMIDPVHDYGRGDGFSVTGGYVYRGDDIPDFQGMYVFTDYGSATYWGIYKGDFAGELFDTTGSPVSFAEHLDGELYVLSSSRIYRLELAP